MQSNLDHASADLPTPRVVLLGASNLVRGISTIVETAWHTWGRPLEVFVAAGHGRSYGARSRVFVRALPGIVQCGLWLALSRRPPARTAALVTDIGNDLLYDVPVQQISEWVEICLAQLRAQQARVALTLLPLHNLATLSPARFHFFRKLFFPRCSLSLATLRQRAVELQQRVQELGNAYQAAVIEPRAGWYGIDPIHVQLRHWSAAWGEILGAWSVDLRAPAAQGSLRRWLRLRSLAPQQRWVLGQQQHCTQPAARWPDGTTIWMY